MIDEKAYLREIVLERDKVSSFDNYPFNIPCINKLDSLEFHEDVTFLVGENGTGKSTLLEAIALLCGFNPEGGTKNFNFSTRSSHSNLYKFIKLVRGIKNPKDGFFLRSESFYNVATNIEHLDEEPFGGAKVINSYGSRSLHEQSHGESFFSLFLNRFNKDSLFILDEPEAALSPSRQMAFISRMHQLCDNNSQFIIATHSPIILSYPRSKILLLDDSGISEVNYEDTEHYTVTKEFLNQYQEMLDILMSD